MLAFPICNTNQRRGIYATLTRIHMHMHMSIVYMMIIIMEIVILIWMNVDLPYLLVWPKEKENHE